MRCVSTTAEAFVKHSAEEAADKPTVNDYLQTILYDAAKSGSLSDLKNAMTDFKRDHGVSLGMMVNGLYGPNEKSTLAHAVLQDDNTREVVKKLDYLLKEGYDPSMVSLESSERPSLLQRAEQGADTLRALLEKHGYVFGTGKGEGAAGYGKIKEKFEYGPFTIVNAGLNDDHMARALSELKPVIAKMKKLGFGNVLYGPIIVVSSKLDGFSVYNDQAKKYKSMTAGAYYDQSRDIVVVNADSINPTLFAHELGHRHWYKKMGSTQRAMWEGDFENRATRVSKQQVDMVYALFKKAVPFEKDALGFEYPNWTEFGYKRFLAALRRGQAKHALLDVYDLIVRSAHGFSGGNIKTARRKYIGYLVEEGSFGGSYWDAKWIPPVAEVLAGEQDPEILPSRMRGRPREDYEFMKKYVHKPFGRLKDAARKSIGATLVELESTTEYGKNNTREDYAEAFAHYITNKPMPERLVYLFRKVNGLKVASEEDLMDMQVIATELSLLADTVACEAGIDDQEEIGFLDQSSIAERVAAAVLDVPTHKDFAKVVREYGNGSKWSHAAIFPGKTHRAKRPKAVSRKPLGKPLDEALAEIGVQEIPYAEVRDDALVVTVIGNRGEKDTYVFTKEPYVNVFRVEPQKRNETMEERSLVLKEKLHELGLKYLGERHGKAGMQMGLPDSARRVGVGSRDFMANYLLVDGRDQRWNEHDFWSIKQRGGDETLLKKLVDWVKRGPTMRQVRQRARETGERTTGLMRLSSEMTVEERVAQAILATAPNIINLQDVREQRRREELEKRYEKSKEEKEEREKKQKDEMEDFVGTMKSALPRFSAWVEKFAPVKKAGIKRAHATRDGWTVKVLIDLEGDDYVSFDVYKYAHHDNAALYNSVAFVGGRKTNIFKSKFVTLDETKDAADPKVVLPARRLEKIFGEQSGEEDRIRPKDFIALLERRLGMKYHAKDMYSIPLNEEEDVRLLLYRWVIMRTPGWGVNGIYQRHKRIDRGETVSIPETKEGIRQVEKMVADLKRKYA